MRYESRGQVEESGSSGLITLADGDRRLARILGSFWLYLDVKDASLTECLARDGYWESWITLWMSRNVAPGSKCIDVGANVGYYSLFLAAHGCEVVAFEANPELARLLRESVALNRLESKIEVVNAAVENGAHSTLTLHVPNSQHSGASILEGAAGADQATFTVSATSLDHYVGDSPVDFIKIDAEGAEQMIWAGMSSLVKRERHPAVLIEWTPTLYEDPSGFFDAMVDNYSTVSVIGIDGSERPASKEELLAVRELEMIVVHP